jgi:hypothetical protein
LAASEGSPLGHSRPLVSAQCMLDWKRSRPSPSARAALGFGPPEGAGDGASLEGACWSWGDPSHLSVSAGDAQGGDCPHTGPRCSELPHSSSGAS